MLPALAEKDLTAFGEALYDFNRRVGEFFRPVQGGTYAHAQTAEVVAFVRQQGVHAVGQSSWGPAIFAIVEDPKHANALRHVLGERFVLRQEEVIVTRSLNCGKVLA